MYNWKDTRNYRRFRDENGNVIANIIYVDGEEVAVSDEVYEAYASMDRRERYLEERDNDDKPLSVDALLEEGYMSGNGDQSANSIAISYDAIVSPVSEAVVNASVASVLFVICWDAV